MRYVPRCRAPRRRGPPSGHAGFGHSLCQEGLECLDYMERCGVNCASLKSKAGEQPESLWLCTPVGFASSRAEMRHAATRQFKNIYNIILCHPSCNFFQLSLPWHEFSAPGNLSFWCKLPSSSKTTPARRSTTPGACLESKRWFEALALTPLACCFSGKSPQRILQCSTGHFEHVSVGTRRHSGPRRTQGIATCAPRNMSDKSLIVLRELRLDPEFVSIQNTQLVSGRMDLEEGRPQHVGRRRQISVPLHQRPTRCQPHESRPDLCVTSVSRLANIGGIARRSNIPPERFSLQCARNSVRRQPPRTVRNVYPALQLLGGLDLPLLGASYLTWRAPSKNAIETRHGLDHCNLQDIRAAIFGSWDPLRAQQKRSGLEASQLAILRKHCRPATQRFQPRLLLLLRACSSYHSGPSHANEMLIGDDRPHVGLGEG